MKAKGDPTFVSQAIDDLPFRAAFENALQFIGLLDIQGHILHVNQASLSFGQVPIEHVRGIYLGDSLWWRHADSGARSRLRLAIDDAASGACVRYETVVSGHGDLKAAVDFSVKPLHDAQGRITHLLAEGHDVTARAEIEQRLRESEERLRLISENTDDLVAILDTKGQRVYNSPSYARILQEGDPDTQADCYALIHPDDRERIRALILSVIKSGDRQRTDFRYLMPDGQYRYLESQISVIRDAQGQVTNALVVSRDIHVRKLAEAEILSLNQQLELRIIERTQELIETNRKLLAEVLERQRAESVLQHRAEQIQQHREILAGLVYETQEDSASALKQLLQTAATTLSASEVSFWEFTPEHDAIVCRQKFASCRNGTALNMDSARIESASFPEYFQAITNQRRVVINDLQTAASQAGFMHIPPSCNGLTAILDVPVWFQGRMAGILRLGVAGSPRHWDSLEIDFAASIAVLISLALETEQRARADEDLKKLQHELELTLKEREAILTNSWVGIAFLKDRRFVWANRALGELQGYDPEELIGTSTELHYASTDIYLQHGSEAYTVLATGQTFSAVRLMRRRDGTQYWAKMHGRAIDPSDLSQGAIWTVDDISDRVRAEEDMLKSLEKEQQLNELKSRFVSMTSHEFRTPLGTILSAAELLECYRDRLPPEQQDDLIANIKNSVKHMVSMLDDVLLIGQADAGRMEFKPRELQLEAFCRTLVDDFCISAGDRIEYASGKPSPEPRMFDEKLLRHILTNLLSNAIKYSPAHLKVYFSSEYGPDATIFRIRDFGIGIPSEDLPLLFESFHRAKNVGDISGTGLGLSIVKRAVEAHGGSIYVDSAPNQGTTFTVLIPYHIDVEQA